MRTVRSAALFALFIPLLAARAAGPLRLRFDSPASIAGLELVNTRAAIAQHEGRRALQLLALEGHERGDDGMLALLPGTDFHDGTIELDLAGNKTAVSNESMRGFIGVAFRVQRGEGEPRFECFYLRPINGRAEDQLQRNHSTQYVSSPEWGWKRLRDETPGKYESYVDLVPGAWTRVRITVAGTTARLYVNGAAQPALIVQDLKRGDARGAVGLWSHEATEGYFSNLTISE